MKKAIIGAILGLSLAVNAVDQSNLRGVLSNLPDTAQEDTFEPSDTSDSDLLGLFGPFKHVPQLSRSIPLKDLQADVITPQANNTTNGTLTNSTSQDQTFAQYQEELAAQQASIQAQIAQAMQELQHNQDLTNQINNERQNNEVHTPIFSNPNNNDETHVRSEPIEMGFPEAN